MDTHPFLSSQHPPVPPYQPNCHACTPFCSWSSHVVGLSSISCLFYLVCVCCRPPVIFKHPGHRRSSCRIYGSGVPGYRRPWLEIPSTPAIGAIGNIVQARHHIPNPSLGVKPRSILWKNTRQIRRQATSSSGFRGKGVLARASITLSTRPCKRLLCVADNNGAVKGFVICTVPGRTEENTQQVEYTMIHFFLLASSSSRCKGKNP